MLACVLSWELTASLAHARNQTIIRDSELESTIRGWADPVFAAAALDPAAVRVILVDDPGMNAFVAGGQNIFLNTGLLMATESASQVVGVIAHETGHIAGGHLARIGDAERAAGNAALLTTLLGIGLIALGAAAGESNAAPAGGAVIAGGQATGLRTFLAFSRAQERAADQAALTYLDRSRKSARGLLEFLVKLQDQELLVSARQDPYVRSHPLSRDRIAFIEQHLASSPWTDVPETEADTGRHARMRAKLIGFLERPRRVIRNRFPPSDRSVAGRYARAVAHMRLSDLPAALAEIDSLLAESADDPYFIELKGQILFENGRHRDALPHYRRAAGLLPDDALIRAGLGRVQVASGDPALLPDAIDNLEIARRADSDNALVWRLLATAYHRMGDEGQSALAAGEHALLVGQAGNAMRHAGRAERHFLEGSPGWLQAQDIKNLAEYIRRLQERAGG